MDDFSASRAGRSSTALIEGIHANAARLSEIDGATGDGDHGINMDKGFLRAGDLLGQEPFDVSKGLSVLGKVLVTEIGGAMGPLYGSFYLEMAAMAAGADRIDAQRFDRMLAAGTAAIEDLGEAKLGDKTLLDALLPAQAAYRESLAAGRRSPPRWSAWRRPPSRGRNRRGTWSPVSGGPAGWENDRAASWTQGRSPVPSSCVRWRAR